MAQERQHSEPQPIRVLPSSPTAPLVEFLSADSMAELARLMRKLRMAA